MTHKNRLLNKIYVCFPTQSARLATTSTQAAQTTVRPWVPTVQFVLLDPTRLSTAMTTRHRARPATGTKQPWPPEARTSQHVVRISSSCYFTSDIHIG